MPCGLLHCVDWLKVTDILKTLQDFKTSITINKLIQHNIPEDMNLQSKTSHRIFSDDENSDVHMSSYGNPPASEVCTKTFLRNESGHLTQ